MIKYTYSAKNTDNKNVWWLLDASGFSLGRIASKIASRIRGKNNPLFTPHVDIGDSVVVINAEKIVLTGKKMDHKVYYRHSGYMGGLKSIKAKDLMKKRPEDLLRFAVKGMLPKNKLGSKLIKKLKVYAGKEHPHKAQKLDIMTMD